jgi:hypothetical protein
MTLCGYGGFCTRAPGHKGTHTASPPPSTRNWDHDREEAERRHGVITETSMPVFCGCLGHHFPDAPSSGLTRGGWGGCWTGCMEAVPGRRPPRSPRRRPRLGGPEMRDVVWATLVVLCVPIWAWIVITRGVRLVEALRARRDLRRHHQLQKAKRPTVDYALIARLEVELGLEEPKVPEVPEWIQQDCYRVAREDAVRRLFDHYGQYWS